MEEENEINISKEQLQKILLLGLTIVVAIIIGYSFYISSQHDKLALEYNNLIDYVENTCLCMEPYFRIK